MAEPIGPGRNRGRASHRRPRLVEQASETNAASVLRDALAARNLAIGQMARLTAALGGARACGRVRVLGRRPLCPVVLALRWRSAGIGGRLSMHAQSTGLIGGVNTPRAESACGTWPLVL
jgi:hypothetical protein